MNILKKWRECNVAKPKFSDQTREVVFCMQRTNFASPLLDGIMYSQVLVNSKRRLMAIESSNSANLKNINRRWKKAGL
jgi:hypothetical protein